MISTKWFDGNSDLDDAYYIRRNVFIKEQNVSEEEEMDGTDKKALHLVVYEGETPVATGRILDVDGKMVLGRIATIKEKRGQGYGSLVVRMLIRHSFDMGATEQYIHAQTQAIKFYEEFGFVAYGEEYLEAGIPHVSMVHKGDVDKNCL